MQTPPRPAHDTVAAPPKTMPSKRPLASETVIDVADTWLIEVLYDPAVAACDDDDIAVIWRVYRQDVPSGIFERVFLAHPDSRGVYLPSAIAARASDLRARVLSGPAADSPDAVAPLPDPPTPPSLPAPAAQLPLF